MRNYSHRCTDAYRLIIVLGVLLFFERTWALGPRPLVQFGDPIVAGDRIFFGGPNYDGLSDSLICIDRRSGDNLWRIRMRRREVQPLFVLNQQLITIWGLNVYKCAVGSGRRELLYRTGYERFIRADKGKDFLVLQGQKRGQDYLTCLDCSAWTKMWERQNFSLMEEITGAQVLLCAQATNNWHGEHQYTKHYSGITGIERRNGQMLWRKAWPDPNNNPLSRVVAFADYFLLGIGDALHCWQQSDGSSQRSFYIGSGFSVHVRGEHLVCVTTKLKPDFSTERSIFGLTVPDFKRTDLTDAALHSLYTVRYQNVIIGVTNGLLDGYEAETGKQLWDRGPSLQAWDGSVHDGCIYFSMEGHDRKHTAIIRLDVKTGERTKLYEESIPEALLRENP